MPHKLEMAGAHRVSERRAKYAVEITIPSTTEVYSVSSGTRTFYLVADSDYGIGNDVYSPNLVLMFFPTSYGSVTKAQDADVDPDVNPSE